MSLFLLLCLPWLISLGIGCDSYAAEREENRRRSRLWDDPRAKEARAKAEAEAKAFLAPDWRSLAWAERLRLAPVIEPPRPWEPSRERPQ